MRARGYQGPILLLTGQGASQQKATALNVGADDYVVKPFDTEELIARVQALLRRGGPASQPILTWGHLSIDPSCRRVAYGTHLLSVTPKEYAILELLLRNPQQSLSSRVILNRAWTSLESPGEEVVRVHIKELRQKLVAVGAPKDFIKTKHRAGYQLNPLYSSAHVPQTADQLTAPQLAELNAVNEELRTTLEQLRSTQAALHQRNQELETAYETIAQERQHLQAARDKLEQRVAERTAALVAANQSLQQQRDQWQALFDHALDAIAISDDAGCYVDANPAACRLFGVSKDELLGASVADFADPTMDVAAVWQQFLHQGQMSGEFTLHGLDGSVKATEFNAIAHFMPGRHLSILRDISERARLDAERRRLEAERQTTERLLRESEERYRLMFESNPNPMWLYDPVTLTFLEVNQAAIAHYGYSRDEFLQMTIADIRSRAEVPVLLDVVSHLTPGQSHVGVWQHCKKDGTVIDVQVTNYVVPMAGKQANLALIKDITEMQHLKAEQQLAEDQLREAHQRVITIWESMTDAYITLDCEWRITYTNPAALRIIHQLTGLEPAVILGHSLWEVFPWVVGQPVERDYRRAMAEQVPVHLDMLYEPTGNWFEMHAYPSEVGLGVYFRDISDRKQLEQALYESKAKLSRILDNAVAAIGNFRIYSDRSYMHEFISAGCEAVYGYPPDDMAADPQLWLSRILPEDREAIIEGAFEQIFAQSTFTIEYRFRDKTDNLRWISETLISRWDEATACWQVTIVATNITDRKQAEAALSASEERYRSLFNEMDEGYCTAEILVDDSGKPVDYRILEANPKFEQLTGLPRDVALSGRTIRDIAPELEEHWYQIYGNVALTGEPVRFEQQAAGWNRWYDVYAFRIGNPDDRHIAILFNDISDRKQAELALRDSEQQFRNMADHAPVMVWVSDSTGYCTYLSQSWYEFSGQTEETGLGFGWLEAIHPDDRQQSDQIFRHANERQEAFQLEYRLRRWDGEYRWAIDAATPWIGVDGQFKGYIGSVIDISDRKQTELEIRRFLSLAENSTEFIGMCDMNFVPFYVNPAGLQLVGLDNKQQYTQTPVREFFFPDDQDFILNEFFPRVLQDGQACVEIRFRHFKTGAALWMSYNVSYIKDENDQPIGLATISRNITDRKQAELELQQQLLREQLIADISQDIRRSLSLDDVLSRTVERIRELLHTDRVIIFRFRPDWQGDVIMESVGDGWPSIQSLTIYDPCFRDRYIEPYRQGRIATLADINTDTLEPCYVEILQQFHVKANLVVPILQSDNLWGLLIAHQCSAPRQWQPSEVDLLRQLATQVSIAIQQSELYEQTRRELSARKQMQAVLEESEERFRALSAAAPIGICQTTASGICIYTNERWQEMSGLTVEESLGNGWLAAVHPDDQEALLNAWNAYVESNQEFSHEFRLLTPQGAIRWVATQAAAMKSATGEIRGYVSIGEDITERKQTEQALRDSQQRLQAILDNSPTAIYLIDLDNRFLLANRISSELMLTTPDTLVGKSIYEFWPTENADVFAANNRIVLETGQLLQTEEIVPHPDGQPHTYITVKFPLRDETGEPYAICGISTDITDKKQLEAQFYRAQRLESLGTLASGVAHDLNNALTPILAISQLLRLKHPNLDAPSQEMLKVLEDSAKRGAAMIKQILTFTRGTGGERVPVELAPLVQEIINVIQQTFPRSIRIRQQMADQPLGLVSADSTHLHQVFMNLCVNARDAMPDGGTLTIAVEPSVVDQAFAHANLDAHVGRYVVVTIADTGVGIPPELRDRIFDPFFTTKPSGQGTGLGLATVLGIVKNYGGFLQVFSRVGHGTQIKVYLPVIEGTVAGLERAQVSRGGHGELILLVDDDVAVQHSTQSLLESHHYRVLSANSGAEAIALYTQHHAEISAVIVDIMMPKMSGIVLIQRLKAIHPDVMIIAMSGLTTHRDAALAVGARAFLPKPYTLEELLAMLQMLVKA